ncbi:MAG: tetratricopeptide repeat protein [Rikenellaceae bacterium]
MKQLFIIISLTMLFLAGFLPTKGASSVVEQPDSLPIRPAVTLTTDGQKRIQIYQDWVGGDSLLRQAIAEDSTYGPAYYYLAQSLMTQQGSVDSVIKYAAKAYELDSMNKWYGQTYAQVLAVAGNYPKAKELYRAAIELEPQNLNAYLMLSIVNRQLSEPLEAIAVLDSAEVRVGKNPYLSSMKQELLIATNQIDRAVDEAASLVEMNPADLESRLALAELYVTTQQDSLAKVEYDEALRIDPSSSMVLSSLARFHAERGNFVSYFAAMKRIFADRAESLENKIATFNRVTADRAFYAKNLLSISELADQLYELYPTNKQVVELYTQHLIAAGKLDEALEVYKERAEDRPAEFDYYTTIIDIESYKQRVDSVELYARRAIQLFPDRHEVRLSQANLYSYTQRFDKAIESYQQTLNMIPSDSLKGAVWGYIGDNYHQISLLENPGSSKAKKQMKKAYKAYDTSLKLYARNAMVLNNYAYFLSLEQRDLSTALDMAGRAIAIEENNPTYMDTYAWVLFELGRFEEAKKVMRQVIALDTTQSAEIQFHYAEILAVLGETFMAEVYYDKALSLGYDATIIEDRKAKLK